MTGVQTCALPISFTVTVKLGAPAPAAPAAEATEDKKNSLADLLAAPAVETPAAAAKPGDDPKKIRWAKLGGPVNDEVRAAVMALGIKGVYFNQTDRRIYPQQQLAAHLVGYVNKGSVPVAGLEAAYDFYLRGLDGWREGERDGRARELAQFRSTDVAPRNGYNLRLSIDATIQKIIEDELGTIAAQFTPESATIIVSDARTGFLLGLANYPTFNLNEYNLVPADRQRVMKNIAVTNQIEPGSTFKIVTLAGAINEGLVNQDSRFDTSETGLMVNEIGRAHV